MMIGIDSFSVIENEQKYFAINQYLDLHSTFEEIKEGELANMGKKQVFFRDGNNYVPMKHDELYKSRTEKLFKKVDYFDLQDLYKWLYYGEFGPEEQGGYLKQDKKLPELEYLLRDIREESSNPSITDRIWDPMGLSQRFIMVYISAFYKAQLPLKTLVNLLSRAPAFRGTRVHFKLDWSFIKEYLVGTLKRHSKEDFYSFEDRINFHQLPTVEFTQTYFFHNPSHYRVVPRKLFFDFFPEFDDKRDIQDKRPKDSLID